MRTTVRLPDDLMRRAKQHATATGRTLTQLMEDAVRAELSQSVTTGEDAVPYVIEPVGGNGLQPGVDLDDSAALLDLMDEQ